MAGLWELQQGVVTALLANAGVTALVSTKIYDAAPRDAVFPYITVGQDDLQEAGTVDGIAYRGTLEIHAWDSGNETSRKKIKTIGDAVIAALDRTQFSVSGHAVIYCLFQNGSSEMGGFDEMTWHGVTRFEILLQKTS